MRKIATICLALSISFLAFAGGNPELVHIPEGYKTNFTEYDTRNRLNGKQVGVLYGNDIAMQTASDGKLGDGAIIVMEIYKAVKGEDDKFVTDTDGNLEKGKFAAIAVMEKRSNWPDSYNANERSGDWGFAIYKADGSEKKNDLDCQSCHTPMPEQDYLFSHASLVEFANKHH